MTENKRFHYDYKTGRFKDTQSNSCATSNMRVLETQINNACYNYEKKINELAEENKKLHRVIEENEKMIQSIYEELTKLRLIKKNLRKIKTQWNWIMESVD